MAERNHYWCLGVQFVMLLKQVSAQAIKEVMRTRWSTQSLEWSAEKLNPKILGWMNYYTRFKGNEIELHTLAASVLKGMFETSDLLV
ncbi:MAG: group II intron maturase-specific domain-containing protein [Segetibacter sp.]